MPCYQRPHHFEYNKVLGDIKAVLQGRKFHHIILEGGETFLWEDLPQLIRVLCREENFMYLFVLTNGTIFPSAELLDALQNPRVYVRFSDYGRLSKMNEIIPILEANHIKYIKQLQRWVEFSVLRKTPAEGAMLKQITEDCCKLEGSGDSYLMDGQMFRCPIQANLHRLGIFISPEKDYVNLRDPDSQRLQEQISKFTNTKSSTAPMVELCRHCNGRGYSGVEVPPAEQLAPGEKIHVRFE